MLTNKWEVQALIDGEWVRVYRASMRQVAESWAFIASRECDIDTRVLNRQNQTVRIYGGIGD